MKIDHIIENILLQQKITIVLLLLSLLVGIVLYKKLFQPDRIFVWFILLELVTELSAIYERCIIEKPNYFCYNILLFITFPVFLFYYKKIRIEFPFYILLAFFLSGVLYSLFFEKFYENYYLITLIFGSITVIICISYYFAFLLKERQMENLARNSSFLISSGLMIFYIAIIPYFLLSQYLKLAHINSQIIIIVLNIILYTFYILAFLCSRQKTY